MSNIGIMEGAFFVGRKEIVDWINETLELNISKVEDTASGAIACQLLDVMYPGQVPMHKVNWAAKQSFEFIANYKILQNCFTKLHIDKFVDVDRLISGRYMDNLEFMQWFKRFYELSVSDKGEYDCVGQRSKGKGGDLVPSRQRINLSKTKPAPTKISVSKSTAITTAPRISQSTRVPPTKSIQKENQAPRPSSASVSNKIDIIKPENLSNKSTEEKVDLSKYEAEIQSLKTLNEDQSRLYSELRTELEGVQKERDFYFDKLRDIEIMLQEVQDSGQNSDLISDVFKILYATAEGFEPVASDDGIIQNDTTF